MLENKPHGIRQQGRVQRHADAAGDPDRQVGDDPLGAVFGDQRHAVAGLNAFGLEIGGHAVGLVGHLVPGIAAHLVATQRLDHGNTVALLTAAVFQRLDGGLHGGIIVIRHSDHLFPNQKHELIRRAPARRRGRCFI